MNFTKYVEEQKQKARLENIAQLRVDIRKSWVQEKIAKHISSFGNKFSKEQIEKEILSNDLVASLFCKDPNK